MKQRLIGLSSLLSNDHKYQELVQEEGQEKAAEAAEPSTGQSGRWCPVEQASWWSQLTYSFCSSLIRIGYRKPLQLDNLWDVPHHLSAPACCDELAEHLAATCDPVKAPQGSILKAIGRLYGLRITICFFIQLSWCISQLAAPLLLQKLLLAARKGDAQGQALGLAAAMTGVQFIGSLLNARYWYWSLEVMIKCRAALRMLLFQKGLRLSVAARTGSGVGAIVNLAANDAERFTQLAFGFCYLLTSPFQICFVLLLLVRLLGRVPVSAALLLLVCLLPVAARINLRLSREQTRMLDHTDARVKLVSEVMQGIKAVKLYAWESVFQERIEHARDTELACTRRMAFLNAASTLTFNGAPQLVAAVLFTVFALKGTFLVPDVAFPALALINLLALPLFILPDQIANVVQGAVSLRRIQAFLDEPEVQQVTQQEVEESSSVYIRNGSFSWQAGEEPSLTGIDFELQRGELLVIIGAVGSGKSSVLAALLQELSGNKFAIQMAGSVAYTAQEPWLQNMTVCDNILMGTPFDQDRYDRTVDACALRQDLAMLPAGDATEIGEKGLNLSGGQKHRMALARACYQDADVYLLDDPLSAVDAHVGQHLMSACICGLLKGKTRVLVTHQLHFLPAADLVMVMSNGKMEELGTYQELLDRGVDLHRFELAQADDASLQEAVTPLSHPRHSLDMSVRASLELSLQPSLEVADTAFHWTRTPVLMQSSTPRDSLLPSPAHTPAQSPFQSKPQSPGRSLPDSPIASDDGRPDYENQSLLANSVLPNLTTGPGNPGIKAGAVSVALPGMQPMSDVPVKEMRDDIPAQGLPSKAAATPEQAAVGESHGRLTSEEHREYGRVDSQLYILYFKAWGSLFALPASMVVFQCTRQCLTVLANWWLSRWANEGAQALQNGQVPQGQQYLTGYIALGLTGVLMQGSFAVAMGLGGLKASRSLHNSLLTGILRFPMSFFDSTPTGRLLNRFSKDTQQMDLTLPMVMRAFLDCLGVTVAGLITAVIVSPLTAVAVAPAIVMFELVRRRYIAVTRELNRLNALALSPILSSFTETLQGMMSVRAFKRQAAHADTQAELLKTLNGISFPIIAMNRWLSVRIETLGNFVVFGAAVTSTVILPLNAALAGLVITSCLSLTGMANWLVRQSGEAEIAMNSIERMVDYLKQNKPEAPAVIEDRRPPADWPARGAIEISKLRIQYRPELPPVLHDLSLRVKAQHKVGIAGRTGCGKSTLVMSLFRVVEASAGSISIDGIDIAKIGLFDLRSRLALVPQDPVIFSGSVRGNLDPFGVADGDAQIWQALEQAGIRAPISALPGGLDGDMSEGGGNLSTGQRQLLCMARALLRQARVLVLDEATSNVDITSDALIQDTVRTAFKSCTVLTVAHRLHTILDSDRVLVLDAGRVKEYDAPGRLLQDESSAFARLVAEMEHSLDASSQQQPGQ